MKTEGQVVYDNLKSVRRLLNMPFAKSQNKYNEWKNVYISFVEINRIDDALRLLKKQIPQLVDDKQEVGGVLSAFCPSCGRGLYDKNLATKYCYNCGQAVKWK